MTTDGWRPTTLLARVSPQAREKLIALGVERRHRDGDILIHQGGRTRETLLLLRGYVKVTARHGGQSVLVAVRAAGDLVGDMAATSGALRSATVIACTPIVARFILPDTLRAFLRQHPEVEEIRSELVGTQLVKANRRRVEAATLPVLGRLIGVILDLIEVCGTEQADGSVELPRWFNQAELAALASVTSSDTVHRCLKILRKHGLIETGYRWIRIKDPGRLAAAHVTLPMQ